jgi:hypothetical protein
VGAMGHGTPNTKSQFGLGQLSNSPPWTDELPVQDRVAHVTKNLAEC